ncbi:acetyltransferase [Clostridium cellulovorans]|nr:acetyltransferase [Clostridium cellulovorans]
MKWEGLPTLIIGTGGTSMEAKDIIDDINKYNRNDVYKFLAFVDNKSISEIHGYSVVSDDDLITFIKDYPVVGVVLPLGFPKVKRKVFEKVLKDLPGIVFPNIIHPSVNILSRVSLGYGNVIAPGVTISNDVTIGDFSLINNNCTIGHDTRIDDFSVINPLSAVSGNVSIEKEVLVGARASIMQGCTLGEGSIVGLGAFVVKDVLANTTVVCKPAEILDGGKHGE